MKTCYYLRKIDSKIYCCYMEQPMVDTILCDFCGAKVEVDEEDMGELIHSKPVLKRELLNKSEERCGKERQV